MEAFQARLDSFSKAKRVKSTKGKSSTVSLKWPHPSSFLANPISLAEAGFYFSPTANDRDNVACYLCKKQLSQWEEKDDPFILHWVKCGDKCPWAVVRCGLSEDLDNGRYAGYARTFGAICANCSLASFLFKDATRLPTSRTMEDARLGSFGKWWPHDHQSVCDHK